MEVDIWVRHELLEVPAIPGTGRVPKDGEKRKGELMSGKSIRLAILAVLGLVLAAAPALVGCGGDSTPAETEQIVIGSLADFSGAASVAVIPTVDAFEEAIKFYQQTNPIEGVEFKFEHYDHRLDYSKTNLGYEDLKARGMKVFYAMGGTEKDMLQNAVAADGIPLISSYGTTITLAAPWIYNVTPSQTWGAEAAMEWIAETWDYAGKGRAPRIGHQGWDLATTNEIQEGIDNALNHPSYTGKFTWVALDKATRTNAAWSAQYDKFKDCDYVFVSLVGNGLATFVAEMRSRGYTGGFMSGENQFPGYFATNVQKTAQPAQLFGCYYTWWGPIQGTDDPAGWYQDMLATTKANHSDSATRLASTGPISGWMAGYFVFDAISRAVEEAGAANLDGAALKEAFDGTDMELEGAGTSFKFSPTNNCGLTHHRVAVFDPNSGTWSDAADKWYAPLSSYE